MSKNRNRTNLKKANNGREYHIIWINMLYPIYWEEGVNFHPRYRKGYKNSNKQLQHYQVREYRTWKYNRRTKWK